METRSKENIPTCFIFVATSLKLIDLAQRAQVTRLISC